MPKKVVKKKSKRMACVTCGQEFEDGSTVCPFDNTKLVTLSEGLAPGEILGDRYEIIAAVAGGGMGKVYKARHKLMNRIVAVKTMHQSLVSSGAALKRFQHEAQAVSQLNHPNILTVFDFFVSDDGQPYMVMDYLEGTNIDEIIQNQQKMDINRALPIFIMTASGLAHAHEHGIIHRDIKPSNIMLVAFDGNPDFVKIIDFGIAKLSEDSNPEKLTQTGDVFGSPQYMSPEQCRARPLDARSDIYSFGCVMYAALTGRPPFTGQDAIENMYKHVHESPLTLSQASPEIALPTGMGAVVLKAMAKEPEERFQSMKELREALESVYNGLSTKNAARTLVDMDTRLTVFKDWFHRTRNMLYGLPRRTIYTIASVAMLLVVILSVSLLNEIAGKKERAHTAANNEMATTQNADRVEVRHTPQDNELREQVPVADEETKSEETTTEKPAPSPIQQATQLFQPSPEDIYKDNFSRGQQAFKSGNYSQARDYFNTAHKASENFGSGDMRYVNSMEWLGLCAFQMGNYQQAKQALDWVLYAKKIRYGAKSAEVANCQKELSLVQKALGH